MWRSLVARTLGVGEVPSSNLGIPIQERLADIHVREPFLLFRTDESEGKLCRPDQKLCAPPAVFSAKPVAKVTTHMVVRCVWSPQARPASL